MALVTAAVVPVLEIGGTHVTAALVDPSRWRVVGTPIRLPVESTGSATEIVGLFLRAADSLDPPEVARWGVAMPDPFDYATGIALFQGVGKFEALYGLDLRARFIQRIASHPAEVRFVNDADAFVLGEWVAGAARGFARCAGLTLGTGVGSGWIADGRIVDTGPSVPPDGRAHRLYVAGRPLEDVVSRRAIRRAYRMAGGDEAADVREISDLARSGDATATGVLERALRALGSALGPYVRRFGAEVLVVGGSMAASWDLFQPWFLTGFGVDAPPIVTAADAEHSPLLGAAWHALGSADPDEDSR